jgi:NDP-sugar pyrophosphorylase family protein
MKAILLAAGRGERMRPITDEIPKMLLPVVNQRLIDINIRRLLNAGVSDIGINLFHHHELLKKHLRTYNRRVHPVVEDVLKGTGGALINFKGFVDGDFIIQSGDVVSDIKLKDIIDFHRAHRPIATLVMIRYKGTKFRIGKDNRIEKIYTYDATPHTYAGIGVFSERIFSFLPQKDVFSIVDIFKNIIKAGQDLMGLPAVMQWYNINSHYTYWKIHRDVLCKRTTLEGVEQDSPIYIAGSSVVRTDQLSGFVSINDNCTIARGVYLENTVVLPGTNITSGQYRNSLILGSTRITVT